MNDGRYAESATIVATFSVVDYQAIDSEGVVTNIRSRDFHFAASDVVVNSVTLEPQAGDRIREVESGNVHEVMPIPGAPPAQLDAPGYRWTVHTKQIKAG